VVLASLPLIFIELDQTRGVRVWKRIEQNEPNDGKKRSRSADPESHNENGYERETRCAGERAQRIFEIAEDAFEEAE
jgi:hypothetical protein